MYYDVGYDSDKDDDVCIYLNIEINLNLLNKIKESDRLQIDHFDNKSNKYVFYS